MHELCNCSGKGPGLVAAELSPQISNKSKIVVLGSGEVLGNEYIFLL